MSALNPRDVRKLIQTTLTPMNLYSANAEEIMMATCAQESLMGTYRIQEPSHIAKGIFQEEDSDFNDMFVNYINYKPGLLKQVTALFKQQPPTCMELVTNDKAAVAICRIHYLRCVGPLPDKSDINGIWTYYKKYYNGPGAATFDQFIHNFNAYVLASD